MMMEAIGDMPKVSGSSIAVPAAGPTPGRTPMMVPTRHPRMVKKRYCH